MLSLLAKKIKEYESSRWDIFPEFDLYMDQLLACVGSPLSLGSTLDETGFTDPEVHKTPGTERFELTAHRVNNYVKHGFIPRPDNRRYSREHLARLYVIRMIKGSLPLALISDAMDRLAEKDSIRGVSERFAELQDSVLRRVAETLENRSVFEEESESDLDYFALALAAEANALALVSETILSRYQGPENQSEES